MSSPLRAGIIGAGYIATWHADAIKQTAGVRLAAVCDVSQGAARDLAAPHGAEVFTDVDAMLASGKVDAVHILTPPQLHADLAERALRAGVAVLVEKPVAVSADEMRAMAQASEESGSLLAVGHNFLSLPGYARLKAARAAGKIGRISAAEFNWCFPLAPLRSGPFGLWMLREPKNLLLELAPHLFAFAADLFGEIEVLDVHLSHPTELPGGAERAQSWRILARAGHVDITVNLSTVETLDDRSLTLRCSNGMARYDYAADALMIRSENAADLIVNPLVNQLTQSFAHLREGAVNAVRQTLSLNRKSAYGLSFLGITDAFYTALREKSAIDPRYSAASGVRVMDALQQVIKRLPAQGAETHVHPAQTRKPKPNVMVIGGTGFIGSHLTRALVAKGHDVRVLSRGTRGPFPDLPDQVETVGVDLKDKAALIKAMKGIELVYNLAKSMDTTWELCLQNDVGVAVNIAEAALEAGVERLVYTGTIASYDMSSEAVTIRENTAFDDDMSDRNLYARSKAECERRLMKMHTERGLPLTIARPGIVIGAGGPLQHWGIGRWHGAGAVRLWSAGNNKLPFVLIEDVSAGLIAMGHAPAALGQSFNLVGDIQFTAREYFDAIYGALGARVKVKGGNPTLFWAVDAVKYELKKHALRRHAVLRPSLTDWKSRAHFSPFDNRQSKERLGWRPESDRTAFVRKGIIEANLLGY
ncbi:NAD-dependent epimerase/dehydratase family protein [Planktotalea arctica]|uniref:NAD-dependent epimerase/dehydratase family protein n=1 Tax=Planktotalea arctica TaxID=1481893 RepID=UPI00321BDF0E